MTRSPARISILEAREAQFRAIAVLVGIDAETVCLHCPAIESGEHGLNRDLALAVKAFNLGRQFSWRLLSQAAIVILGYKRVAGNKA